MVPILKAVAPALRPPQNFRERGATWPKLLSSVFVELEFGHLESPDHQIRGRMARSCHRTGVYSFGWN